MVREPDATTQPTLQDIQLMSKHRVLSFKSQLRLEWRGQDGQNETEQPDHSASSSDSITASTQIRFSVHTTASSDIASKIRHQTPLTLHRLKRRNTLFQSPNFSGRSRQGEPVRTIHSTPSTNIRLSRPVEPFWSGRPMISGAIRAHAASLNTNRSITPKTASQKAALNLICWQKGILRVHRT